MTESSSMPRVPLAKFTELSPDPRVPGAEWQNDFLTVPSVPGAETTGTGRTDTLATFASFEVVAICFFYDYSGWANEME